MQMMIWQLIDMLRLGKKGVMWSQLLHILVPLIGFAVLLGLFIYLTQDKGSEATEASKSLLETIFNK